MAFDLRLVTADRNFSRFLILKFLFLDINRHVNQYRALTSGGCNIKSLFKNPRNILYIFNKITIFYKRFTCTGDICFLKNIFP